MCTWDVMLKVSLSVSLSLFHELASRYTHDWRLDGQLRILICPLPPILPGPFNFLFLPLRCMRGKVHERAAHAVWLWFPTARGKNNIYKTNCKDAFKKSQKMKLATPPDRVRCRLFHLGSSSSVSFYQTRPIKVSSCRRRSQQQQTLHPS
jgi:hypothetical protein